MARFFGHGELALVVLSLLGTKPRQRYELMSELGRLFAPSYSPSPGSVYPAIDALEAEGLIRVRGSDEPPVYHLTRTGRAALVARADALAAVELRTGVRLSQRSELDAVLNRFAARVRAVDPDPEALEEALEGTLAVVAPKVLGDTGRR
jgi:DNA-binding PadR family transcriptional regulator